MLLCVMFHLMMLLFKWDITIEVEFVHSQSVVVRLFLVVVGIISCIPHGSELMLYERGCSTFALV